VPAATSSTESIVKVFVQGDSSRLPDFIENCRREFGERGMKLQLVRPDESFDYNIVVAQESSLSGAAATVIALDSKGLFVASVVRSGRMSGKGAFNASAKELAKKLSLSETIEPSFPVFLSCMHGGKPPCFSVASSAPHRRVQGL
jgi:hypothetical protein